MCAFKALKIIEQLRSFANTKHDRFGEQILEGTHIQSFSERRSIERRSERTLITSERERERRSNSFW